eukprot:3932009-Rhodomonas_salina.2
MLARGPINVVSAIKKDKDCTTANWRCGNFTDVRFGEPVVTSKLIPAGNNSWKVSLFPKGYIDADWASLYVTCNEAEMAGSNSEGPQRITQMSFASIKITVNLNMRPPKPGKDKSTAGKEGNGDDVASQWSGISRSTAGSRPSQKTKGSSIRSGKAGSESGSNRGDTESNEPAQPTIVRKLTAQFTNLESSWGFERRAPFHHLQ